MGEKYFPFDSVNADRVYRAEDFASFFGDVITSGVSVATENPLAVTAGGGPCRFHERGESVDQGPPL